MPVPLSERGVVVSSRDRNRPIRQEAVQPVNGIPRSGFVLERRSSLPSPDSVVSMKNRGQGGRSEKGDERRVKRKPETKRQRRIKKNGGDKGK